MGRLWVWAFALCGLLDSFHAVVGAQEAVVGAQEAVAGSDDRLRLTLRRHAWRVDGGLMPVDAAMTGSVAGEIWTSGIHDSWVNQDTFPADSRSGLAGPTVAAAVGLTDRVEVGARLGFILLGNGAILGGVELRETIFEREHTMLGLRQYIVTGGPRLVGGGFGAALRQIYGRMSLDLGLNIAIRGDNATMPCTGRYRAVLGFDIPLALTWVVHPRVRLGAHLAAGLQLDRGDPSVSFPIGGQFSALLFRKPRVDVEGWISGGFLPIMDDDFVATARVTAGIRLLFREGNGQALPRQDEPPGGLL